MKKAVIFSILMSFLLINYNNSEAAEKKTQERSIIYETPIVQVVKEGSKYGVLDKNTGKYIVKPVLDGIITFSKDNDIEYKVKSADMVGYMNLATKDLFISRFDDISIINGQFLKIKKDGKFGIITKKGQVLIPAEYENVAVTKYDDIEYLIGRGDNRYNIFYNNGNLVIPEDLGNLGNSLISSEVAKYLNPAVKEYRMSILRQAIAKKPKDTNYIIEDTEETVEEVGNFPLPSNVKKLSVEQQEDYISSSSNDDSNIIETVNTIDLDDKKYSIVNVNGKLGLQTNKGKELIPAEYTILKSQKIDNHDYIAAVGKKSSKLYDKKGNIVAIRLPDKICVYTRLRKYEYYKDENIYKVAFNNRKIGELEISPDGTYKYTPNGFSIFSMKKANEIFASFVNTSR